MVDKKQSRTGKIIKKTGKVFAWILGVLLCLTVAFYIAINNPKSQTWMAQRVAAYLSGELKAKITIRAVSIEFFKKVDLQGIYMEDQHGDTLLYADKLIVDVHRFDYDNKYLSLSNIRLSDSKIKLKKYRGEHGLSYRFLQDYFQSSDTTSKKNAPWKVDFGGIDLDNVTFAYVDTRDTINDRGMDYENIRVTGIKASFYDIDPMGDSVSLKIKNMQGRERCGLALKDLSTRMTVSDSSAHLDDLHFITTGSTVDGFLDFYFHDRDDFADDFVHLVKMDGHFSNSVIEMGDIAYFAPELLGIKKKVLLTGDIKGTVDHLKCKNVDILFGESSHLAGNFSFNGLPDINETDMNFRIREAKTNKKDLEGIPVAPFGKGKHLIVDNSIGYLGDMSFTGSFEGFLNDFVAYGNVQTALGSIRMENLAMTRESDTVEYSYIGEVRANHFNIGKFYDIPDLSFVSGDVNIEGTGLAKYTINAKIDGNISELVYHSYSYSHIKVSNGKLRRQVFDGDFDVDDPNVNMAFTGSVDNSGAMPQMKFTARIDSANLGELGFADKAHENILSADLNMNFKGNNVDNIEGTFRINNMNYSKDGEKFRFNEFLVVAGTYPDKTRGLSLQSDIVDVNLSGKFTLMQMPHAVSDMLSNYLPSYFPPDKDDGKKDPIEEFTWIVNFKNNTKPIKAIIPKLEIAPLTYSRGSFSSVNKEFNASFTSSSLVYNDIAYNGINISAGNKASKKSCTLTGSIDELRLTDTIATKNIRFESLAANDSLRTSITWDNKSEKKNDAAITALVHFENQKTLQVNFLSTQFHVNDSLWQISPGNFVRLDSGRVGFHNLVFTSDSASIGFNGFVSKNPNDELKITANRFNIAYLNYFTVPKGLTLAGFISSETGVSNLYDSPVFTSNTQFTDFFINGQKLGDGDLTAVKIPAKQAVYVKGNFTRGIIDTETKLPINNVAFDGFYYPKLQENSLDINATFISIPLQTLQPLLKDFCSVMVGQIDGNLHIGGTPSKLLMNGKMDLVMRMVRVDYLGLALHSASQPVTITENSFAFDDYKVMDENGNTASIYGNLFHTDFSNFQFDMDFSFDHFMVLNTTSAQNDEYYGRVFATGYMNVFGYVDDIIHIDMQGTTEKIIKNGQPLYSEFNIPMTTGSSEVSNNDFITFVSHDTLPGNKNPKKKKTSGLAINLNVTATQDAIVHVIFDKTVGDELTAYGEGNIQMNVKPSGDFEIRGRYEVEKGNYLFTMKDIVKIPFNLAKGGVISWNGDPYQAQIDADAVYTTPASVEPFFPNDSINKAYHRSYPVDVVMHLDGDLMNPGVSFDINLPTADQNIQETVKSYTQTELERNKQVLSLMVLNSFMTPTELRDGNTASTNYTNAGSTLLSNFVSGTLNNWLGQISTDFNMGVVYRPNDDLSTPDLKVFLSTQLLNNRITIDGNLGKVNATQAVNSTNGNGQWVGDVNVEYKVTDDGKVRLRAFNRSNDNAVLTNSALYTQGAGILYKEEFETWRRLGDKYRKFFSADKKNAADTTQKR
jgi:hypothetical protein